MELHAQIPRNAAPLLAPGEQIQPVSPAQLNKFAPRAEVARSIPDSHWRPRCRHCDGPIGLHELVGVVDGQGFVAAATAMELRANPGRYRGRAGHLACVQSAPALAALVVHKPLSR
jgi:hypothetical protein